MSSADAQRWNQRYQSEPRQSFETPRPFLLESASYLPVSGHALDAAMGLGGNAGFLLERGLTVIGIDVSEVAARRARARLPGLAAVVADLTAFYLPPHFFDVILNFYYLERSLWPAYVQALRPGGLLIFETLTVEMRTANPEIDPHYLLEPGELRQAFPSLVTRFYREAWIESSHHPRPVASLIAQKPR